MKNKNLNVRKPSKEELRVKKEIELWDKSIAKKYSDAKEGGYLFACMNSALKAYKMLLNQGHTGTSISITMDFLNKLASGKPLTPLTGEDSEWDNKNARGDKEGVKAAYQNKRYTALFKEIYEDGTVKYHDNNRVMCYDPIMENYFQFGLANLIYDDMEPIEMPYYPLDPVCIEVFAFQSDQNNAEKSDFDTVAILNIYDSCNDGDSRTPINRFFREPKKGEKPTLGSWVEIDVVELADRIKESSYKNLDLSDLGLEELYKETLNDE